MNTDKRAISKKKVAATVAAALVSLVFSFYFQEEYSGNSNAITILATVFSILAGFLIAVFAIVADDRALRGQNWRSDVGHLVQIKRDLRTHQQLFYLYLTVLVIAFVTALDLPWPTTLQTQTERLLIFLASWAMISSFRLPGYLMRRHLDSLEREIKKRRDEQTGR